MWNWKSFHIYLFFLSKISLLAKYIAVYFSDSLKDESSQQILGFHQSCDQN